MTELEGVKEDSVEEFDDDKAYIPADELLHIINIGAFVGKLNGQLNIKTLYDKEGAKNYLSKLGYKFPEIDSFIKTMSYRKVDCLAADAGQPVVFRNELGEDCLNSYVKPTLEAREGSWPIIKRVLDNLTDGKDDAYQWLVNWLAAKVQAPTQSLPTALALLGASGTGKGTIVQVMFEMLGPPNCVQIGQNLFNSDFTSSYAGKCLVNVDEALSSESAMELHSKAKRLITADQVEFHAKGRDPVFMKNCAGWMFTSNSIFAMREDEDDRRITSLVQASRPTPEYTATLKECFYGTTPTAAFREEIAAFKHYLLGVKVDRRMATTPLDNATKKDIAALSRNSAEDFWTELTTQGLPAVAVEVNSGNTNRNEDLIAIPADPGQTTADGKTYRTVTKALLFTLYTRFAKLNAQKVVGKNRFFVIGQQRFDIQPTRLDGQRAVRVWGPAT